MSEKGYKRISLSVQKANYAVQMYERAGFRTILENDDEYIMVCDLLNESGLYKDLGAVKAKEEELFNVDEDIHDPCLRFQR